MTKIIATLTLLLTAASARPAQTAPEVSWQPHQTECSTHDLEGPFLEPSDAPQSTSSLRLAIIPDYGMTGEKAFFAAIYTKPFVVLSDSAERPSIVILGWGMRDRSCTLSVSLSDCPQVTSALIELREASIPIMFEFGNDPTFPNVLHGDRYYLDFQDGQGNHNQWSFYGTGHPLQQRIQKIKALLTPCAVSALKALDGP